MFENELRTGLIKLITATPSLGDQANYICTDLSNGALSWMSCTDASALAVPRGFNDSGSITNNGSPLDGVSNSEFSVQPELIFHP